MFFFCKDVKVYNYQCHYHGSRNRVQPIKQKKSTSSKPNSRINSISTSIHLKQTKQDKVHQNEETLLQKVRKRNQSLETTLYATVNNNYKRTDDTASPNINIEGASWRANELCVDDFEVRDKDKDKDGLVPNFSFSMPKQIMSSQTLHQRMDESEYNYIIEQQSQLVQPCINGKFMYIAKTTQNQQYQQHLAIDLALGSIVSLKSYNKWHENLVYIQNKIYNKITSHPYILDFYHILLNNGRTVIVKEPYTLAKPCKADHASIADSLSCALQYLQTKQIYVDYLQISDIKQCFGIWKLSNFRTVEPNNRIPISQNIQQLISQIQAQNQNQNQ